MFIPDLQITTLVIGTGGSSFSFPTTIGPTGYFLSSDGSNFIWAPGTTGPQGASGPLGGPQGETGYQGVQGPFGGPQGRQGIQGTTGIQGGQGIQGVQGRTGFQGRQGRVGATGAQGEAGTPGGPPGPEGLQGPFGPVGEMGPQGYQGYQGLDGNVGNQGVAGPTGDPGGPQGNTGFQGVQGGTGYQGVAGAVGNAQRYGDFLVPLSIVYLPITASAPIYPGQFNIELASTQSTPGTTASVKLYDKDINGNTLTYYWDILVTNPVYASNNFLFIQGYHNYSLRVDSGTYFSTGNYYQLDTTINSYATNSNILNEQYYLYYYVGMAGNLTNRLDSFTATSNVVVNHNSGVYPVVQIVDSNGEVLIPLSIQHTSLSSYTVQFSTSSTGTIITGGGRGPSGSIGFQGFQGNGVTGPTGFQGNTGIQGPQGINNVVIAANQIVVGTGSGVTSSSSFTFNIGSCLFVEGSNHTMDGTNLNSLILGGSTNNISYGSCKSSIIGGLNNTVVDSLESSIIGGNCNQFIATDNQQISIIGGKCNSLNNYIYRSSIIGGYKNCMTICVNDSSIIGGCNNKIWGDTSYSINQSSIIGGSCNLICANNSNTTNNSIVSGYKNNICVSNHSSIVGGQTNTLISSTNSVIIGGSGLSFTNKSNTVIVPSLTVASSSTTKSHINLIAGASPSVPVDGDLWYDGTALFFRLGGTTVQLT